MTKTHRIISGILCLLLMTALPLVALANFSDVPDGSKSAFAIQTLKDAGIVAGYQDSTFKPENPVSRAEAVAIILKAAGITATKTSVRLPFTDVPEEAWFFPMIQKGVEMGKIKGYEDKTFRPMNTVTLPEALAFTLSFFRVSLNDIAVEPVIYDGLDSEAWYAKQAQYAKNKNLIEPDPEGHVNPSAQLKRSELAEIIYRMRIAVQTGQPFDITSGWVTTEYPENFWRLKHPADWELFKGQKNSVIWKRTGQEFFTRVWPDSARISISVVENPEQMSAAAYFEKLKNAYAKDYRGVKRIFGNLTLGGRPAYKIEIPERRVVDVVVSLPNQNFLVMYGEYGDLPIGEFFEKQLELVLMSYQFVERPPEPEKPVIPIAERMAILRENILVADTWKEVTPLFPDKKLIETDAIGIGTGPVDYYYSAEAGSTIKLERNSGTVLNIREGETSAF